MYNKYDESRDVERELIKLKDTCYDKIVRPVDAFITFLEEDGKIVAGSIDELLDDKPLFCKEPL